MPLRCCCTLARCLRRSRWLKLYSYSARSLVRALSSITSGDNHNAGCLARDCRRDLFAGQPKQANKQYIYIYIYIMFTYVPQKICSYIPRRFGEPVAASLPIESCVIDHGNRTRAKSRPIPPCCMPKVSLVVPSNMFSLKSSINFIGREPVLFHFIYVNKLLLPFLCLLTFYNHC